MDPNKIEELLTCSICLDRFQQPKVLPCQHTFCLRPCLEGLVDNGRLLCPQCRAVHNLPSNGVDGFPSNLTIVQLLDVPTENNLFVSTSCQKCRKKNCMIGKCFHCDNFLCRQCLTNHSNILEDELNESISRVSTRIPQLSQKISEIQRCQTEVRENEKATKKNIEKWFDDCMSALQAKKKKLLADVGDFSNKESEMLDEKREVLQVELAVIKSFCEDAEKQRKRASASEEISEHQVLFIEILEQSKAHLGQEVDETTTEKYAKFCDEEAQSIIDSISNFRGIDIATRPFPPLRARHASSSTGRNIENVSAQDPSIVQNYRSKGRVKRCFGREGSEIGCFDWPREITVTADDEIVVADSNNNRIQIFDTSGNSLRTFGRHGNANGEFKNPLGVCVTTSGQIVVADTENNRIQVFDNQGRFISAFGQEKLNYPSSVATNSDGLVFVADASNSIKVFSLNGDFIRTFGESWLDSTGYSKYLTVAHDNKVIVCEHAKHIIGVFDESFQLVLEIGTEGDTHGQFKYPSGVVCDRHGNIIIADSWNNRIQVLDKDGNFITSFGSQGSQPGQMDLPTGVAVLRNGDIVVSDTLNNRIQIF